MAVQNLPAVPSVNSVPNIRDSQSAADLSGIFSVVLNRSQHHNHVRWPSFSASTRSFWTKYCLLCTVCGSAATILAGIFLVVAALFRYYTTSIYYFETVPTYIPAILLSICGVSTIAFSCKRNRNIILLRITACWSLVSAALSSVITITTSLIHMNRLQTLKECVYNKNPPSCTCFSHNFAMDGTGSDPVHYVFENTPDCDVIHGTLYSCLRAVFAISVVAVLLSIFLCMLLYQLIGHERKKAYWSRIRRINSDWSADFIACLARPMPRERSSLMPLILSPSASLPMSLPPPQSMIPPPGWGPPPPYEAIAGEDEIHSSQAMVIPTNLLALPSVGSSSLSTQLEGNYLNCDGIISPHPFSPTITSVDPVALFRQHQNISPQNHNENVNYRYQNENQSPISLRNYHDHQMQRNQEFERSEPKLSNIVDLSFNSYCEDHLKTKDSDSDSNSFSLNLPLHCEPKRPLRLEHNLENLNNVDYAEEIEISDPVVFLVSGSETKIVNTTNVSPNPTGTHNQRSTSGRNISLPCSPMLSVKKYFRQKSAESVHNIYATHKSAGNTAASLFKINRRRNESCLFASKSITNVDLNVNVNLNLNNFQCSPQKRKIAKAKEI